MRVRVYVFVYSMLNIQASYARMNKHTNGANGFSIFLHVDHRCSNGSIDNEFHNENWEVGWQHGCHINQRRHLNITIIIHGHIIIIDKHIKNFMIPTLARKKGEKSAWPSLHFFLFHLIFVFFSLWFPPSPHTLFRYSDAVIYKMFVVLLTLLLWIYISVELLYFVCECVCLRTQFS